MLALKDISLHYTALCSNVPLKPIRTERDYRAAVKALNGMMDAGVTSERHPLANLLALLGNLIGIYEETKLKHQQATPAGVMQFLMEQHGLSQKSLPEIGSQGVVSELLAGKRALNLRQIHLLAKRFNVSPTVFFADLEVTSARAKTKL
ncbi:MAG TPA: helix-turn-helix domain-containing protein [Candidatus Acidoferrum sp.]|nr:helix-turn-helix domain-containing protein [Candidatus Acidoferrum sp.]